LVARNKHNGTRSDIFYHTMYIGGAHRGAGAKNGGWGASVGADLGRNPTQLPHDRGAIGADLGAIGADLGAIARKKATWMREKGVLLVDNLKVIAP